MNPQYINPLEFHNFTNHWTACPNCYPQHDRYCEEGKRLHGLYQAISIKHKISNQGKSRLEKIKEKVTYE